jgi:hypothetical protein
MIAGLAREPDTACRAALSGPAEPAGITSEMLIQKKADRLPEPEAGVPPAICPGW